MINNNFKTSVLSPNKFRSIKGDVEKNNNSTKLLKQKIANLDNEGQYIKFIKVCDMILEQPRDMSEADLKSKGEDYLTTLKTCNEDFEIDDVYALFSACGVLNDHEEEKKAELFAAANLSTDYPESLKSVLSTELRKMADLNLFLRKELIQVQAKYLKILREDIKIFESKYKNSISDLKALISQLIKVDKFKNFAAEINNPIVAIENNISDCYDLVHKIDSFKVPSTPVSEDEIYLDTANKIKSTSHIVKKKLEELNTKITCFTEFNLLSFTFNKS